jgi:hypothetical protein
MLIRVHTFNQYSQQHLMYNKHKTYYRSPYNNLVVIKCKLSTDSRKMSASLCVRPLNHTVQTKNSERPGKVYFSTA